MKRRDFITLLGGAVAAWPVRTRAQQSSVRRIGVMLGVPEGDLNGQEWLSAFVNTLEQLGWRSGNNVRFETRWTGGDANKIRAYASELTKARPDVILSAGTPALSALHKESTSSIPIVCVQVTDVVASGFVASMAHPGGNITGFVNFEDDISGKWPALLKEVAPRVEQITILINPNNIAHPRLVRTIETSAMLQGIRTVSAPVSDAADIERVIGGLASNDKAGLVTLADTVLVSNGNLICALAARHKIPAIYPFRIFTKAGGLVSYGSDQTDLYRRAASYVDRILRGAKAGELPVQTPTKFELVINLNTAKALGLVLPESLLLRADEVIE